MESMIMGTAGHIDHGKTALVKALTGHDTDTLVEEKKRGISINLGFTSFCLPNGRMLGIVDVPGHERFIKNMLAGATGIDLALIVIAANEGIMPQTREHIDILSYLDIQKSLIVLTKIDLVEDDFKELVIEDIESFIKGTFLEGAKLIEVDSISKKGIDQLISELEVLTADMTKRKLNKKPRMNIDRVFSVKGHGTVVTGTLMEGAIYQEDEMMVYPIGIATKVRNIQVHDQNVEAAFAGQRTAVNISNISVEQVHRGCTIAVEGGVYVTNLIDVRFSIVKNTTFEIGKFYKLKLYVGASEEVARFNPITHKKVKAGDQGYAQILLDHPITVLKGDRFVLRSISPVTTIGGGVIVDPAPVRYKKITDDLIQSVVLKDSASDSDIIEEYIKNNAFATIESIFAFVNKEIEDEILSSLEQEGQILCFGHQYIHIEQFSQLQNQFERQLKDYHINYPLRGGIPKAELYEKLNLLDKKQFEYLVSDLAEKQIVKVEHNLVSIKEYYPVLTSGQKTISQQLEQKISDSGYSLITVKELTKGERDKQQIVEFLLQNSHMLLPGQYILERKLFQQAKAAAEKLFLEQGVIRLPDFRDVIGASRKYALLLLEKFDQEKFTRRLGEDRIINKI